MIKSSFLRRCILAAAIIPMVAAAGVALSPKPALADEEGCFCRPSKCSDFDATCYIVSCSDGTGKTCDGKWITDE